MGNNSSIKNISFYGFTAIIAGVALSITVVLFLLTKIETLNYEHDLFEKS